MIHLLPLLRFGWRRNTPTNPQTVAEPPTEVSAPVEPAWDHRPPEPPTRAETCGHCGELIGESPDGEFCGPVCHSRWLAAQADTITKFIGPVPVKAVPELAEPSWLAAWSDWERKKAAAVIEARKVPATPYVPGAAVKAVAEGMADAEPIHPMTPAPGQERAA